MYKKVDTNMNFVDREKETVKFWKENGIFEKSIKEREGSPMYMFYDGPPTANGKPHIGHVLTRVIKDTIPRYHAMKGEYVPRKAGWDTHGLPVEIEVEKKLGLDGKEQIEEYGNARNPCGSTRACGESSLMSWASGRIWIIRMSPITTIISNRSGGRCSRFMKKGFCMRATR